MIKLDIWKNSEGRKTFFLEIGLRTLNEVGVFENSLPTKPFHPFADISAFSFHIALEIQLTGCSDLSDQMQMFASELVILLSYLGTI